MCVGSPVTRILWAPWWDNPGTAGPCVTTLKYSSQFSSGTCGEFTLCATGSALLWFHSDKTKKGDWWLRAHSELCQESPYLEAWLKPQGAQIKRVFSPLSFLERVKHMITSLLKQIMCEALWPSERPSCDLRARSWCADSIICPVTRKGRGGGPRVWGTVGGKEVEGKSRRCLVTHARAHARMYACKDTHQSRSAQVTHRPSSGPWVSPSGTSETPGRRPEVAVSGQSPAALHL